MKFQTLAINPWFLIRNTLLLLTTLLIAFFLQSTIFVSPSHPFVDDNGDGIDDFEQGSGRYEDPAVRVEIYGVTFPIAELGNCGSYSECRSYCEDPLNSQSCIDYGRSKGFYQGESDEKVRTVLAQARTTLGCDSQASCQNFCEVPANYNRCATFARSQGITGGYVDDPSKAIILAKAAEVLGCTTPDACKSYCEQEANRDKCSDFAKQAGLAGGEHQVGPGGCTSEATCKAFCSDPNNFQICSGFASTRGGTFSGPGGCNNEASCRTYCQQNEAECSRAFGGPGGGPGGSPPPGYNPQEMCNRTPNCAWTSNSCQCGFYGETEESQQKAGEYAAFCQTNPDKCKPGRPGFFDNPEQRQQFEDFCTKNPDKCKPPSGGPTGPAPYPGSGDPAAACARYGCSWSNNNCRCTSKDIPAYDPAAECAKIPRCSWTGSTCHCTYIPPAGPEGCPDGQYVGPGGYCISGPTPPPGGCPAGQYMGPGGYCISGSGTPPTPSPGTGASCPQGQYIGPGGYCIPSSGTYSPPPGGYSSPAPTYYPTATYQPSYDPATECAKQSGCSWTGSSCQCSSSGGTSTTSSPQPTQTESTQSTPPPTTESSGGSSGGSSEGSCPSGSYMKDGACVQGVYGVSTSLLQYLLDLLR